MKMGRRLDAGDARLRAQFPTSASNKGNRVKLTEDRRETLFSDRQFMSVWLAGIVLGIVRWMEFLAVGIFAFDVTGSAFLVALLALLRFAPLALFGVFIGALSDLMDSARLLRIGLAIAFILALIMTGLFVAGVAAYWHVAMATFAAGILFASDLPLRRKLIGDIAGLDRLAEAMSIDTATSNGTRMIGPLIGGLAYQWVGGVGIFAIGAALYAIAFVIMQGVKRPGPTARPHAGSLFLQPLVSSWQAIQYAFGNREVMSILGVTVVYNIWGFPMLSMVPVIGKDVLGMSAASIGAVSALEGTCAFLTALVIAGFLKPRLYRRCYYYSTWVWLLVVVLIGTFPSISVLVGGLIGAGIAGAGFATMQSTLIFLVAPVEMRGRLLGVITICIGSGLIGFANIGYMAEVFGPTKALWIVGLEGVVPMIIIGAGWRQLRD